MTDPIPEPVPAASGRPRSPLPVELAVMATVAVGAAGTVRLATGGLGGPAAAPLLVLAVLGFVVPAALLRTRLSATWSAVIGTMAVVVVALWAAAPRQGSSWFPDVGSLLPGPADLHRAHTVLAAFHLPLDPLPAIVLLGAVLTGVAGLAGRLLLGPPAGPTHPALATAPGAVLTAWSCLAVPGTGAVALAAVFAAVAVVALATGAPAAPVVPVVPDEHRGRPDLWTTGARMVPVAVTGLVVVGATVGAGIVLHPTTVSLGKAGAGTTTVIPATTLSLAAGLVRVEQDDPSVVVFRTRTPSPTYWQVGVLTVWNHDHWVPGPTTAGALAGRSTTTTAPTPIAGIPLLRASVSLDAYAGHLLPVPPATVAVSGLPGMGITAAGVVTPAARRHAFYNVTFQAVGPGTSGSAPGSARATDGLTPAQLRQNLSLPPVPGVVTALARSETAGATSTLAAGEDLVNWFRSGRFRYTLSPPPPPTGTDPLAAFLTVDRAGSCESFASAFAVMARTLGIPARVAVGFTAGTIGASGATTVVGADAHAWPELYLGSGSGWVSFEPTPPVPGGPPVPSTVVGTTSPTTAPVPTSTPTTTPVPTSTPTTTPSPTSTPTTAGGRRPAGSSRAHTAPLTRWPAVLLVAGGAGLVVIGVLLSVALVTRRRRRRPPAARVVAAARSVDRSLRRVGAPRPDFRTLVAHADDLAALTGGTVVPEGGGRGARVAVLEDIRTVADVAQTAAFDRGPVSPAAAQDAERAALRVRRTLRRRHPLGRWSRGDRL
ncbi:MAG: transglutaminase-like domain-containing protein [Acidimicrobiales bacterium]